MAKSIAHPAPSPSQVSGRLSTWHRVMEEAGLTYDDLQKPIDDPAFRKNLVEFWHGDRVTDVNFNVEEDWFTFTTSGKSLNELYASNPDLIDRTTSHWRNEKFAQARAESREITLRTAAVPYSCSRTFSEQISLLKVNERVPSVREVVDGAIQYFRSTGKRIFPRYYVRCSDVLPDGDRVSVACYFVSGPLLSTGHLDDSRYPSVGLAVCRDSLNGDEILNTLQKESAEALKEIRNRKPKAQQSCWHLPELGV